MAGTGSGGGRTGIDGGPSIPPQVLAAIDHLEAALVELDEIDQVRVAAQVATALYRLKVDWGIDA